MKLLKFLIIWILQNIFEKSQNVAIELGEEIKIPCIVFNQTHRSNYPINSPEDYFRVSLYQPYIDSLIQQLKLRFSNENSVAHSLLNLHPNNMNKMQHDEFKNMIVKIYDFYKIDNFFEESMLWYNVWKNRITNQAEVKNISFISLLDETNLYPAVHTALTIALTLPVTTCSIERTFSTLRRVKTWTRNTISDDRLNGLCMIAVHKEYVIHHKFELIEEIINEFGLLPRRMELLFNH